MDSENIKQGSSSVDGQELQVFDVEAEKENFRNL